MAMLGITMKTRACRQCHEELPRTIEFWHKKPNAPDGLETICKPCKNASSALNRIKRMSDNHHRTSPKKLLPGECGICGERMAKPVRWAWLCEKHRSGALPWCGICRWHDNCCQLVDMHLPAICERWDYGDLYRIVYVETTHPLELSVELRDLVTL